MDTKNIKSPVIFRQMKQYEREGRVQAQCPAEIDEHPGLVTPASVMSTPYTTGQDFNNTIMTKSTTKNV